MADIEVNISSIASLEKRFEALMELLQEDLGSMYSSLQELNQTWEGPKHDVFVETFENRYCDMEQLQKSLKSYQQALKKAKKTYKNCEEEVYQIVRKQ